MYNFESVCKDVLSYGPHIKMKFRAPLLLGDFKNFLIPPRMYNTNFVVPLICEMTSVKDELFPIRDY